jgi:hypothetical protein
VNKTKLFLFLQIRTKKKRSAKKKQAHNTNIIFLDIDFLILMQVSLVGFEQISSTPFYTLFAQDTLLQNSVLNQVVDNKFLEQPDESLFSELFSASLAKKFSILRYTVKPTYFFKEHVSENPVAQARY